MRKIVKILAILVILVGIGFRLSWSQVHPDEFSVTANWTSAQTNTIVVSTPTVSGISLCISDIVIANGATAGVVTLLNGFNGTVIWRVYVGVNTTYAVSLQTLIKLTANTALFITSTTVTTHSVTINGIRSRP